MKSSLRVFCLLAVVSFWSGALRATVINASPVNFSGGEAANLNKVVATFTDSNSGATPGDFNASIDWGDGSSSAGTITASGTGGFNVNGRHSYADEGTFSVTVTINDNSPGVGTATVVDTASITEADSLSGSPRLFHFDSGVSFTKTVATFTNTLSNTAADFIATIDWGDATISAGTVSGGSGAFQVAGTHTYASTGNYSVMVTLSDDAPGTATATVTSTATSSALLAPTVTKTFSSGTADVNSGDTVTASFSLSNPNSAGPLTGVSFTDTLPLGLIVSTPNGLVGSCGGGIITATAGSDVISLGGATLQGSGSCTFQVNVTVQAIDGTLTNPAITLTSDEAPNGISTPATVSVSPLFFLWFFMS